MNSQVNPFDFLAVISQVSATLLGFIAVFIVLSGRDGRFAEADRHFVSAFLYSASLAFLLGMTPGALSYFLFDDGLWTASLGVAMFFGVITVAIQARSQFAMSKEEAAKIHWGWHLVAWGMGVVAAIMMLCGLFGIFNPITMYIAAANILVLLALWSFVSVVFRNFF